jgi:hypothetical protein
MKKVFLIVFLGLIAHQMQAQIIALTVGAIIGAVEPEDKTLSKKMKGVWEVESWINEGDDLSKEVEGVLVHFPKCSNEDRKGKNCTAYIHFTGGEVKDVLDYLGGEEFSFKLDTRKELKAEADTTEGIHSEDVPKGGGFTLNGKSYKYQLYYKKKKLYFTTYDIVEKKESSLVLVKSKMKEKDLP